MKIMSLKTWEFDADEPLRSIIFPYIMIGIPSVFLSVFYSRDLKSEVLPYLLLVFPRLLMCFVSLAHDLCIYKICILTKKNPFKLLTVFASSYVTLTYLTRTFSNSLEGVCLSILIYIVVSKSVIPKRAENPYMKTFDKSFTSCVIGILFACGCFTRPTFALFAFVPLMAYFVVLSNDFSHFLKKTVIFCFTFMTASFFFAFVDTVYYKGECHVLSKPGYGELKKMVLTPLNFILYNLNPNNLAKHGYHPKYLHFLINIPLMYTVLGIYAIWFFLNTIMHFGRRHTLNCSKRELFFLLSFLMPILFLSAFSHQEPRFLIPVIVPLICLFGEQLFDHLTKYRILSFVWVILNISGTLFFGFIHQGGVTPSLSYLHTQVTKNPYSAYNIVFYHTYMPPRHLLAVPKQLKHVSVYDLAGSRDDVLLDNIQTILNYTRNQDYLYVVLPGTMAITLVNINIMLHDDYKINQSEAFFPHFSIEDMPVMGNIWMLVKNRSPFSQKVTNLKTLLSLHVYEIIKIKK